MMNLLSGTVLMALGRQLCAAAIASSLSVSVANADAWVVDPAQSSITFEYVRGGNPAEGRFDKFEGTGTFDPANPEAAELVLRIDSESIDLFDTLASAFATSAEWFDSRNHRYVVYELHDLEPLGGDRFTAIGSLTLRGQTETIRSEITMALGDDGASASGSLEIDRTDYLLGVGPAAAFVTIGKMVAVRFKLAANKSP